jgi:hypothetical protein
LPDEKRDPFAEFQVLSGQVSDAMHEIVEFAKRTDIASADMTSLGNAWASLGVILQDMAKVIRCAVGMHPIAMAGKICRIGHCRTAVHSR